MSAPPVIRVVDLESTGFAPPEHVPIEVGWCDVEARGTDLAGLPRFDVVGESFGTALVHPRRPIPPESSAIHHLTDDDFTDDMPGWRDVIAEVCEPAGIVAFAAHTAKMERQWFTPDLTGGRPWICTWKCALRAWPDSPSHSNQVLRYWRNPVGIDRLRAHPPHRALPDAYVTSFLLRDLLAEHPIETLIRWTEEPTVLVRVPFGEHRGKRWSEVDDGLLDWVLGKDFDADVVHTVKLEIARRETLRRAAEEAPPALAIQQVGGGR